MFSKSNKDMATIQSQMQSQSRGKFGFKKSTKMSKLSSVFQGQGYKHLA
jgi:hypothetical protein